MTPCKEGLLYSTERYGELKKTVLTKVLAAVVGTAGLLFIALILCSLSGIDKPYQLMPIQRSPVQGRQTLEEYYQELESKGPIDQLVGQQMLQLLEVLKELFPQMTLWGLTSMARLGLSPDPEFTNAWFVLLSSAIIPNAYQIEYLMPANRRPWEDAFVQGQSQSVEETKRYLLIAMRESEGWVGNQAFEAVLTQYGLAVGKPST
jgi:hypothetical protein